MAFPIFILEDDPQFRKILELRLRSWRKDLDITVAESISAAKKTLDASTTQFSLAILDQQLPDGSGVEMLEHSALQGVPVLAVSADDSPELPANAVSAGAAHFLGKRQISAPLFIPLLEAIIRRQEVEKELLSSEIRKSRMETIRTLLGTLRHEINNPLGAVLGGAYLMRSGEDLSTEQVEAVKLIEESGKRIKHVLEQLCDTAELEEVTKGHEQVFHIPGDPAWDKKE